MASRYKLVLFACLINSICFSAVFAEQHSPLTGATGYNPVDTHSQAYKDWNEVITYINPPGIGCFYTKYPNTIWQRMPCQATSSHIPSLRFSSWRPQNPSNLAGYGYDYTLVAPGSERIYRTIGYFPSITGVKSEFDSKFGKNAYSLQINTNTGHTTACGTRSKCTVWHQFVYGTGYDKPGQASLFMAYFLRDYDHPCPTGWSNDGSNGCWKHSSFTDLPIVPVTQLRNVALIGIADKDKNLDKAIFIDNATHTAYENVNKESDGVDIAQIWTESEFNVFGLGNRSRASFNAGSTVTVKVGVLYYDLNPDAPICKYMGFTGEGNNFRKLLGKCEVGGNYYPRHPYIQFTETTTVDPSFTESMQRLPRSAHRP